MGRLQQMFIAPGPDDDALPTRPSWWHDGRCVLLPLEHWEVIVEFAERLDADKTQILRHYAYSVEGKTLPSPDEHKVMVAFIRRLQAELRGAPPLVPEVTAVFQEDWANSVHVLMLDAVVAVFEEAQRLGEPFEGDVDT